MSVLDVLLWGFVATLVLTVSMAGAVGLGWSRMSLPFVLGTMFTADRTRAPLVGTLVHLVNGWAQAGVYALLFESLGRATWWIGAALGVLHGLVMLLVVLPALPGLHPRMADEYQGPEPTRNLEPPGFLALNYGRRTPLLTLAAHLAYGAILGGFYTLAGA